jgi:hypothetical protein
MLPLRPVQTGRWIPRRIPKAELSSDLKNWNSSWTRLLFHRCCYHRPLGLRLLQVREKEHEGVFSTVTFVSTFL